MKAYHLIYLIKNIITNKIYIGYHSTNDINDNYFGSGLYIKKSIKKYGRKNFKKEILEICNLNNWEEREMFWINEKQSKFPNGYNLTDGGEGGIGKIVSNETKQLMSLTRKNRKLAVGENNGMFGQHHSKESCDKMSKSRKEKGIAKGKNNGRYDNTIYIFKNTISNEIFKGTKNTLSNLINSNSSALNALIKGYRKKHKNWIYEGKDSK